MEVGPNGSSKEKNANTTTPTTTTPPPFTGTTTTSTTTTTVDPKILEEIERIEFYKTYDVMTGVRIAATLGGFFGLMVILVLYKSKSKTEKALEDPAFTAAAVAEAEEEERQLAAVLEATAYQQLNPRRSRQSLDTSSMPPGWIRTRTRFSSVGGYSSLMEPPTRTHSRLPSFIDEDSLPDEDQFFYEDPYCGHLEVPRRASNITCSSSGSSYLERRDSAVVLGLPALPAHKQRGDINSGVGGGVGSISGRRRQSSPLTEIYDFYYPIDIRVIQPTPGGSPCGSAGHLYDNLTDIPNLKPKLAPLASISSCNSSVLASDFPELADVQSYISDSVFCENNDDDTEDEVEPFSTDSDEGACCSRRRNTEPLPLISPTTLGSSSKSSLTLIETPAEEMSVMAITDRANYQLECEHWSQETLF